MGKKVVVSRRFRNNTLKLYEYLIAEYSAKTAFNFLDRLQQRVELILRYPEIGKLSQKKQTSEVSLSRHTTGFITGLPKTELNYCACLI